MYILLRQGENDPEPVFHSTEESLNSAENTMHHVPGLHPEGTLLQVLFKPLQLHGLFGRCPQKMTAKEGFQIILVGSKDADIGTFGSSTFDPPVIKPTEFFLFNLGLSSRSHNDPTSTMFAESPIREAEKALLEEHGPREGSILLCREGFGPRTLVTDLAFRGGRLFIESCWEGSVQGTALPLDAVPEEIRLRAVRALPKLHQRLAGVGFD